MSDAHFAQRAAADPLSTAFRLMDEADGARLAAIDRELAQLMAERVRLTASRAGKRAYRGLDPIEKSAAVSARQAAAAQAAGLPEKRFKAVLEALDQEAVKNLPPARFPNLSPDGRAVVIVGGGGGMGQLLKGYFERSGLAVRILEKNDWPRAQELLADAGLVILSVPITAVAQAANAAAAFMPSDAVLADVASVKAAPLSAMLEAHAGPVLGLHPMFGPDTAVFEKQVFVACPGRGERESRWVLDTIRSWGATVHKTSAADHDRAMGIIQALRHFCTFAYGVFLSKLSPDLAEILALSSPIYRLELSMVGRLFAQDPHLYAEIIMSSEEKLRLIERYVESLAPTVELVRRRDIEGFCRAFFEARGYFGELAPAFMKESALMLALAQTARAEASGR